MKNGMAQLYKSILGLILIAFAVAIQPAYAEGGLKPEEIEKISSEAQKTLNGFTWNLEVTSMAAKKEDRKAVQDIVIFKDGKMSSEGLQKKGFGTSNYTLTVGDDGVPVFETMQRDTEEGVAFWRGELVEGKIRGVISVQAPKTPATTFGFHGQKAGEATEIPAERVEPQPEPVAETVEGTEAPVVDTTIPADDAGTPTDAVNEVATDAGAVGEAPAAEVAPEAAPADIEAPVVDEVVKVVPTEEPVKKEVKQPWWMGKKK